jgi:hypothetical protein
MRLDQRTTDLKRRTVVSALATADHLDKTAASAKISADTVTANFSRQAPFSGRTERLGKKPILMAASEAPPCTKAATGCRLAEQASGRENKLRL